MEVNVGNTNERFMSLLNDAVRDHNLTDPVKIKQFMDNAEGEPTYSITTIQDALKMHHPHIKP